MHMHFEDSHYISPSLFCCVAFPNLCLYLCAQSENIKLDSDLQEACSEDVEAHCHGVKPGRAQVGLQILYRNVCCWHTSHWSEGKFGVFISKQKVAFVIFLCVHDKQNKKILPCERGVLCGSLFSRRIFMPLPILQMGPELPSFQVVYPSLSVCVCVCMGRDILHLACH